MSTGQILILVCKLAGFIQSSSVHGKLHLMLLKMQYGLGV